MLSDTFQVTPKLTLTYGPRVELPGSEGERRDRDTTFLLNQPDPLSAATGLNLQGQLALVGSPQYPSRYETALHTIPSPRVGFAWRPFAETVIRGGYGLSVPGVDNWIGYGPAASSVTQAVTYLPPGDTMSSPFSLGVNQPLGHAANFMSSLEGGQLVAAEATQPYSYTQQWNFAIQRQIHGFLIEAAYTGNKAGSSEQRKRQRSEREPTARPVRLAGCSTAYERSGSFCRARSGDGRLEYYRNARAEPAAFSAVHQHINTKLCGVQLLL